MNKETRPIVLLVGWYCSMVLHHVTGALSFLALEEFTTHPMPASRLQIC